MSIRTAFCGLLLALPVMFSSVSRAEELKYDVLELPSAKSEMAARSMIFSVSKFGDRYFATGHQGHILYSDDGGDTWTQADVPVRSSLLDIHFPTPEKGWAVGHEGVILHSSDGGKTWVKQYDGKRLADDGVAQYQEMAEENPDNNYYPLLVGEMEFAQSQGADKPFFKVHCRTTLECNAIGAYGIAVRTDDGGKSWINVMDRIENDLFYHLFDYAPLPGENRFFIAGEAGVFLIADIDPDVRRAERVHSVPWEGSFFSSSDTADGAIVMGGLRGRMFRTEDEGVTWVVVEKPVTGSIIDIVRLSDDRLVAASVNGSLLVSADNGLSFSAASVVEAGELGRINSIAEGPDGTLILGGPSGLRKVTLQE